MPIGTVDVSYNAPNYHITGGTVWEVSGTAEILSGGQFNVLAGGSATVTSSGALTIGGTALSANVGTLNNAISGTASGFRIAAGTTAFAASGTALVFTGLTSVLAFQAGIMNSGTSNLVGGLADLTGSILASGSVNVFGYTVSGSAVATSGSFSWIAFGT